MRLPGVRPLLCCTRPTCRKESNLAPSIEETKAKHASRLLELPGVVSVGIGRDDYGRPAIVIGLIDPLREEQAQVPSTLEGHPVVTRVLGAFHAP